MEDTQEWASYSRVRFSFVFHCRLFQASFAEMIDLIRCRYGHGVLRNPDPRFMALQEFCDARPELNSSPIIRMVKKVRTQSNNRLSNSLISFIFRLTDL
jgi:hypothetical protein